MAHFSSRYLLPSGGVEAPDLSVVRAKAGAEASGAFPRDPPPMATPSGVPGRPLGRLRGLFSVSSGTRDQEARSRTVENDRQGSPGT